MNNGSATEKQDGGSKKIIDLITQVGFPIAMVVYFVFRFEKKIDENTKAINNLTLFLNGNLKK